MTSFAEIPSFLYGTAWKEERTEELTRLALDAGFVGIDTANQRKHYFEIAVGKAVLGAITAGRTTRPRLFLQTKFTFKDGQDERLPYDPNAPIATQVRESFASSLEHFQTDYLDSYLLHGPTSRGKLSAADLEAWRAIEALASSGQARFVGVSNFTLAQLQELLSVARVKPKFLQNRCYARSGWDRELRLLCARHDIVYQGFSLLTANRKELGTKAVTALAARLQRTPEQLVFAFARQVGMLPLTGTSSPEHMRLDLGALDFRLERADLDVLESVSAQTR
jgi:diketogulonate reductase-like aldo/keto reductase